MSNKKKFLLSRLVFIFALFVSVANAQKLSYSVSSSPPVSLAICDINGRCISSKSGVMETGNAFCTQYTYLMPVHDLFVVTDTTQTASITYGFDSYGNAVYSNRQNVTQISYSADGPCSNMDPAPDSNIAYQVHNTTTRPLTFLQVFTTENNGTTPYPKYSGWLKWWHKDSPLSLEAGSVIAPGGYFPLPKEPLGQTGWFTNTSGSNGTRWFITYSHGDDCFSTTFYNDLGVYSDQTNLCDYTKADSEDVYYRPAALNIADGSANMLYPTLQRSCNITMYPVDLKYCKN
ncbi:MAG: hypothetical protein K0R14_1959 [Burkholderiales bacterium]|jgi:hypothetical protein|nr:hypothetical protein [Burkholderiales bacterium]